VRAGGVSECRSVGVTQQLAIHLTKLAGCRSALKNNIFIQAVQILNSVEASKVIAGLHVHSDTPIPRHADMPIRRHYAMIEDEDKDEGRARRAASVRALVQKSNREPRTAKRPETCKTIL
jgi:hypothetical protein